MWNQDDRLFLQLEDESGRQALHAVVILGADGSSCSARFEEAEYADGLALEDLTVRGGQEVQIYFEVAGKFLRQNARIQSFLEDERGSVVRFEATGEPVSGESREAFRVSIVADELVIQVGGDECRMWDVSATGFAVVTTETWDSDEILDVALRLEDREYRGRASIASTRKARKGGTRYGFRCISDQKTGGDLERGLQKLTMAVQREQLRRRAGL